MKKPLYCDKRNANIKTENEGGKRGGAKDGTIKRTKEKKKIGGML